MKKIIVFFTFFKIIFTFWEVENIQAELLGTTVKTMLTLFE